jgi:hypothetical protein
VAGTASIDVSTADIVQSTVFNLGGTVTGSPTVADPLLSALANNGGPTFTMSLQAASPANNTGNLATCAGAPVSGLDQRGVTRGTVLCEIGAVELGLDDGSPCTLAGECRRGICTDSVCCNQACGGNNAFDCQACSIAKGATVDGVCQQFAAGVVCRPARGLCDIAETCGGSSTVCPFDQQRPPGFVCRPKVFICDFAETCVGSSDTCPGDRLAITSDNQLCRAASASNDCSINSFCNGNGPGCAVVWRPAGTVCRKFTSGVVTGCGGTCNSAGVCGGPFSPPAGGLCP